MCTLALFGGLVAACMLVRATVQGGMLLGQEIPLVPGLFSLRYLRNPGAAFGLLAAAPEGFRLLFFIAVAGLALVTLTWMYIREGHESRPLRIGLAIMAGGAAANLWERLLAGDVVDYLDVYVGSYHWPTFNLADTAISVGVGLLLLDIVSRRRVLGQVPDRRGQDQR